MSPKDNGYHAEEQVFLGYGPPVNDTAVRLHGKGLGSTEIKFPESKTEEDGYSKMHYELDGKLMNNIEVRIVDVQCVDIFISKPEFAQDLRVILT